MSDERMVTLAEAAAALGIAISSLHRHIKRSGFRTYRKVGDRRAYLKAGDLERLKGFMPRDERRAS